MELKRYDVMCKDCPFKEECMAESTEECLVNLHQEAKMAHKRSVYAFLLTIGAFIVLLLVVAKNAGFISHKIVGLAALIEAGGNFIHSLRYKKLMPFLTGVLNVMLAALQTI